MAILTGFLMPSLEGLDSGRLALGLAVLPVTVDVSATDPPALLFGSRVDTQPVTESPRTRVGFLMASFDQDFYNTIWIFPNPVDLGVVVDGQTVDVHVWNAYFTAQSLARIVAESDAGLSLFEPFPWPTDFLPLELRTYQIVVSVLGPATIDADYTFYFPSDVIDLHVFGYRAVLFAFRPNWQRNYLERLEWLTDVIEAYDGSEQRIGLRNTPRRFVEYELLAHGQSHQQLRALLWAWQSRVFTLPIWTDSTVLSAAVISTALTLYVDSFPDELVAGGAALVYSDDVNNEVVSIAALNIHNITLVNPLIGSFAKGSRIYPVRAGRLVDTIKVQRHTAAVESTVVRFIIDEISAVMPIDSTAVYRSLPVLEVRPNWDRDVTDEYQTKLSIIDFDVGQRIVDPESAVGMVFQQMSWLKTVKSQIRALRGWFYARKGRLMPIWVPSWSQDLTLALPVNAANTEIYINGVGYGKFYGQMGRKDIRIELKSGAVYYRRISSPIKQTDGTEKISIDGALGVDVSPNAIRMISFLTLSRLNADAVEIAYHTPEVAEATVTFKSLLEGD